MNNKLLGVKKISRPFKAICLVLSTLITLQTARFPIKAAGGVSQGNDEFLTSVDISRLNIGNKLIESSNVNELQYDSTTYNSVENALEIGDLNGLIAFAKAVNSGKNFEDKFVKLTKDIDLDGTEGLSLDGVPNVKCYGEARNVWTPIGTDEDYPFKGTFDGGNHKITGMTVVEKSIQDNQAAYAGLFGVVKGATIKNVGIADSYVISSSSDSSYAGGLVGYSGDNEQTTIINSYVEGTTVLSDSNDTYPNASAAAGLVGASDSPISIYNSYSNSRVYSFASNQAKSFAGELLGCANDSVVSIINSYSMENVYCSSSNGSFAGGLVGYINCTGESSIKNSYAATHVFSFRIDTIYSDNQVNAGGILGCFEGNNQVNIEMSYSLGNVSASSPSKSTAGGAIGQANGNAAINTFYSKGNVSSNGANIAHAGGLVGTNSRRIEISKSYVSGITSSNNESDTREGDGNDTQVGGLIGVNTDTGYFNITHAYWNKKENGDRVGTWEIVGTGCNNNSSTFDENNCRGLTPGEINGETLFNKLQSLGYIAWSGNTPTFAAGRNGIIESSVSDNENLWTLLQNEADTDNSYANWVARKIGNGPEPYENPTFVLPANVSGITAAPIDHPTESNIYVKKETNLTVYISWDNVLIKEGLIDSLKADSFQLQITPNSYNIPGTSPLDPRITKDTTGRTITLTYTRVFSTAGNYTISFNQNNGLFKAATVTKNITVDLLTPVLADGPITRNATYGQTLGGIDLETPKAANGSDVEGSWSWYNVGGTTALDTSTTTVGNATAQDAFNEFNVKFTPVHRNIYKSIERVVQVKVGKADPDYTTPSGLVATYGQALSDVRLPDCCWSWDDPSQSVGNVGNRAFGATYNNGNDNYNSVPQNITVKVNPAAPRIRQPINLTATYGQKLGDIKEGLPSPLGVTENELSGQWSWTNSDDDNTLVGEVGKNIFNAIFTPDDTNYNPTDDIPISVTVSVDKSGWGTPVENNGVTNYVAEDGTTSAEVDKFGMIWLKEESGGTSTWYGIDNSKKIFRQGSRLHVRWLNEEDDKEEWEKYYAQIDKYHKILIDEGRIWIFLIGVTDPDGNEYRNFMDITAPDGKEYKDFEKILPLYIQFGEDWDENDLKAIYIASGEDEIVNASVIKDMEYPEGIGKFGELELRHFSPYAVYDRCHLVPKPDLSGKLDSLDKDDSFDELDSSDESDDPISDLFRSQTGDVTTYVMILGLAALIIASGGVLFITRKRKKSHG